MRGNATLVKLALGLTALGAALGLAACGGGGGGARTLTATPPPATTAIATPTPTPTPTPKPELTELPRPEPEGALRVIFALGDTVVVTVAIIGPVAAEPGVDLDGRSADEVKRDGRTLEIKHIFRKVNDGEHMVHVAGGNFSQVERVVVTKAKVLIPNLRSCQVLPLPTPTPLPPSKPTPTPPPVLEIRLESVESFDGNIRAVFWFGPGGYRAVTLDGNPPDIVITEAFSGMPAEFIFLGAGGGEHALLAQGYPHRLEIRFTCDTTSLILPLPTSPPSPLPPPPVPPPSVVRFQVYGTVYDARQGSAAGIAGAQIVGIFGGEGSRVSGETNVSGNYELAAQGHAITRSDTQPVRLEVTAAGYARATLTCVTVGPADPFYSAFYSAQCDIALEPKPG